MFKEKNLNFTEVKKKLKEEKSEILYPEHEFLKLEVTPAEKIRYKANTKMAKIITSELNSLILGEIKIDEMEEKSKELMQKLNPEQRKILENITKSIINGDEKEYIAHSNNLHLKIKRDSLQDKYRKYGDYQATKYFYAGLSDNIDRSGIQQVKLMPWGAVVVYVNDEKTWRDLYDPVSREKIAAQGFIKKYIFQNQVDWSVDDYSYINKQYKRTIFVRTDNISKEQIENVEKHELFHELYNTIFSKNQKIRYNNPVNRSFFKEVKNESMAYLFAQIWEYHIDFLVPSSIRSIMDSNVDDITNIWNYIKEERLRREIHKKDPKLLINNFERQCEEYISKEEKEKIINESTIYIREFAYFLREIIILKYLKSNKFEEAKEALLTSQSFKEMRYKLGRIERMHLLIPSACVNLKNLKDEDTLVKASLFLTNAINYRLPVKNIGELIEALKKRKEECSKSNKKNDKKELKFIDKQLEYYKENGSNIINME